MTKNYPAKAISKILSANDTGDTGGHQAGILIPKDPEILDFFPTLSPKEKNPRHHLFFHDNIGERWEFAFIYYNSRLFDGTRNEYRLTRMTAFLRTNSLKPGDEVILLREGDGRRKVLYKRAKSSVRAAGQILRLGSKWKIIDF